MTDSKAKRVRAKLAARIEHYKAEEKAGRLLNSGATSFELALGEILDVQRFAKEHGCSTDVFMTAWLEVYDEEELWDDA
jgi:hypothetical protein